MFNSRFFFCLLALTPATALANSAPEKGPPAQFQPNTANPVPPPPTCPTGRCPEVVDPVVLSGGKLYYPMVDVVVPGLGRAQELNLRFFRGYSSQDNTVGVLGKGWCTTLDIHLGNVGGTTPYFRSDTGNEMFFTPGTVTFHDGHVGAGWQDQGWTLEVVSGGDYEMCEKFGWKYRFNSTGRLRYIEDSLGHRLTYNRNALGQVTSITDASSRSLTFSYDLSSRLTSLTDPLGRVWGFGYHPAGVWGAGMLAGVKGPAPLNLTEYYYYADDGNMVSLKNPRGNVTTYQYDAAMDRVTRMTHPNGQFVQFAYNNFLGVSAMTDEDGKVWQYEYTGPGLVTNIIDPINAVHHYEYNVAHELIEYRGPLYDAVNATNRKITYTWNNHNLERIVDETGTVKEFTYHATNHEITGESIDVNGTSRTFTLTKDANRRVTAQTDAMGEQSTISYDPTTGLPKTLTDRRGKLTTLNYDSHGNVTSVVDANNQSWTMTYDTAGRLLTRTSPIAGTTNTFTYDVEDRVTRITDAAGKFWDFTFDEMGNVLTEKTPLANTTTTYTYDARDRRITATDPLNATTTYAYNGRSLVTSITDPASLVTTFDYDNAGRRTKMTQPPAAPGGAAVVTEFTYNLAGELTSVKDAKNQITQFSWTPATRTTLTTFPDASTETSEYDEFGSLVEFKNRSNQVQNRSYNANGWMTAKNCPTCGVSFTYDKEGNLTQAVDANTGTFTWTYDNRNQVLTSVQPGGTTGGSKTISYTYDNAGRPLTMTYPDGTTLTYTHNSRNLVTNIQSSSLGGFAFAYDDAQRRTGLTFPNNHTGAYTYDTASRPTGITWNTNAPSLIASQSLAWNAVGNITSISTTNGLSGTRNYSYDQLNRLTGRTTSGSLNTPHPALTWNLDAVGNRTSTVLNGTTTTYALNASQLNQYATVGGNSQTWDTRGNLLTDGTRTLTYDADNRLATAAVGGTTVTYTYDFAHRLARRSQTGGSEIRYLYDQEWNVIATISGTNGAILQKWIHGPSVDEVLAQIGLTSATTYYLTKDHLGSTTTLVKASTNAVSERYTYDEYGGVQVWDTNNNPVSSTPLTRYLFTGREYDSTIGLYHYRHRWYHPAIGRFIQPDPIGFRGGHVDLHSYVGNTPMTEFDPSGLTDIKVNGEIWRTPIKGDAGHPHVHQGVDQGPHMHGPDGSKFFPKTGMGLDKNGRWEQKSRSWLKKMRQAVRGKLKKELDALGILTLLGLLAGEAEGSNCERIKEIQEHLEEFLKTGKDSDAIIVAQGICSFVDNNIPFFEIYERLTGGN